jgi:hypothetical protein
MPHRPSITKFKPVCFASLFLMAGQALAQGGCGSACLPLEFLDVFGFQVSDNDIRMSLNWQDAEFHNFRVDDDDIANPGGNSAIIQDLTVFLDYGFTDRFTVSLLLPYIKKRQQTNRFNERTSKGLGDVALFDRYELLATKAPIIVTGQLTQPLENTTPGASVAVGLGLKFPTGSIEEPGGGVPDLPRPFQNGTGAHDMIGTANNP